jgi:prolyl-tRNA editing enzyme YbaK/EbsC (Cys-tRNA(Pro) deacylase)
MTDSDAIETRVKGFLNELGISFETIACQPDQADTAVFCEVFGIDPEASVNTILVASKKEPKTYAACLVLANTRLDVNRKVRKEMGVRKCSFASFEETETVTGMLSGGVTPFDLPPEIPILIDARITGEDVIWLGGGSRSLKIGVRADDLASLPNARVVDGLAG